MEVSVVIPAFNAMKYLPETLASALQQTHDNFEIVIIDDGSKDGIRDWVAGLQQSKVILISQENRGLAAARNRGILESKGRYIAFLDADDLWLETKLSKQVHLLNSREEIGLVYTWIEIIDSKGRSRGKYIRNVARGKCWDQLMVHNMIECGSVPLVRRKIFEEVGLFDENLGSAVEDRDMWLRIAARYELDVVEEPLVRYRHHAGSASRNWPAMERSSRAVIERALECNPLNYSSTDLALLKKKSYAASYLRLAWKPLQTQQVDLASSLELTNKALEYDPEIESQADFRRLKLAQRLIQLSGVQGYNIALRIVDQLRLAGVALRKTVAARFTRAGSPS